MADWKKIKAITLDVDGVMTDGCLVAFDDHEMVRVFNAKDSFAMRVALMRGIKFAVFSGGETEGVRFRFITCGLDPDDIHLGCRGKIKVFREFCEKYGLGEDEVLYIGDDIPDLPVIKAAGIGAAPADAAEDVVNAASYVCKAGGGRGCVREVIEKVLRAQGLWYFDEDEFSKIF